MPYNAQDRIDLLGPRMTSVNPDPLGPVTIRNPRTGHSVETIASLGTTEAQEMIPGVAITNIRYQDFIITVSDLDFGAGPMKPEIGWEIDRQNGETYRVISLGDNNPPFDYTTSTKKRMRIHTEFFRSSS